MFQKIQHFIQTELGQNLRRLFTGVLGAQVISVIASWLLTRYCYTPIEYGVALTFVGLSAILANLATLRYELMIVLPKAEQDAARLTQLSYGFVGIFFVLCLVVCLVLQGFGIGVYSPFFWILLPFSMAAMAGYQILVNYLSRQKDFRGVAQRRLLQVVAIATCQMTLDTWHVSDGLIWGWVAGNTIAAFPSPTLLCLLRSKFEGLKLVFYEYLPITRYSIFSSTLNAVATNLQPMLITMWFGAAATGWFSFVDRIWQIPIRVIQGGVSPIYYAQAAEMANHTPEKLLRFSLQVVGILTLFVAFPMILASFCTDWWVALFFGERWLPTVPYLRILVGLYALRAIFHPISFLAEVKRRTDVELWFSLYFIGSSALSLWWGSHQGSFEQGLWAMLILNSVGYLGALWYFLFTASPDPSKGGEN